MTEYEVVISQAAERDLERITGYISNTLLEPEISKMHLAKLKEAILSLNTMPERHALVRDAILAARGIRVIPVENYLIFYIANTKKVQIIRVLYAKRTWETLL